MSQQVAAAHLVGDRHPVLTQKMTYECPVWVPL